MDPEGHFQKMRPYVEWMQQSTRAKDPSFEVTPFLEGANTATIVTIPFALGLLAALQFRTII